MNHKDPDWLYEHYVINEMSTLEIGDICGITSKRVCAWLSKHGIPNRRTPVPEEVYELIRDAYTTADENGGIVYLDVLSSDVGYSEVTICRCARLMGLTSKTRPKRYAGQQRPTNRPGRTTWNEPKIRFIADNFQSMTYSQLGNLSASARRQFVEN